MDWEALGLPDAEEFGLWWSDAQEALRGGSLEALARMRPAAERAVAMLDRAPATRDYASWLQQRLDYFEVAEETLREAPARSPSPPHILPSPTGAVVRPPSQPRFLVG